MPKLILLQDIEELGNAGDAINVAPGFARNYLIPKGLAVEESPAALRQLASRKGKIEEQRKNDVQKASDLAAKIAGLELVISAQASDDQQLFGSVNAHMIAEELAKHGVNVETRRIHLEQPIKTLGEFEIPVKLRKDMTSTLKLKVAKA